MFPNVLSSCSTSRNIDPLHKGHLCTKATFRVSHKWPLYTGLTVYGNNYLKENQITPNYHLNEKTPMRWNSYELKNRLF